MINIKKTIQVATKIIMTGKNYFINYSISETPKNFNQSNNKKKNNFNDENLPLTNNVSIDFFEEQSSKK